MPGLILFSGYSLSRLQVEAKAAIVDQFYMLEPNQPFIDKATTALQNNGFKVDCYHGDEINVDFYRNLPTLGYKVIIFRAHSGLQTGSVHQGSGDKTIQRTYLFTNEPSPSS